MQINLTNIYVKILDKIVSKEIQYYIKIIIPNDPLRFISEMQAVQY